jgi:hypothetical protein
MAAMTKTTRGLVLLSAVASLAAFAGDKADKKAAPKAGKEAATVRCEGINECKGKGECGSATYDCAGNNECKGKGWISVTAKECKDKKGTVLGAGTK